MTNTTGWICPKCGSVYAPFMPECIKCGKATLTGAGRSVPWDYQTFSGENDE